MTEREFDIVLLGASGFTGRLVAEYLLDKYADSELKWAMAGRNQAKLESVRSELKGGESIPILLADTSDGEALLALAGRCRVVCTTVGPYALYGSAVVEACVKKGTHYCDLTGEIQWMQQMIAAHQATAEASGARIVHTCGFDSIPSDIGVFYLQSQMRATHGVSASRIKYRTVAFAGGFSGGTVASMINMMEEMRDDPSLIDKMADPYLLNPEGSVRGSDVNDQTGAIYDEDFGRWTLPFMMAAINTRVVRRSNALLNNAYGEDFNYEEAVLAPAGQGGMKSKIAAAAMGMSTGVLAFSPLRAIAKRFLPKPGEGPDKEARENGYFDILLHATHPDDSSKDMRARVTGDRDPGYGSTSKMLAESAICLARDELSVGGGFWTPASAMGEQLTERLIASAGLTFDLVDASDNA